MGGNGIVRSKYSLFSISQNLKFSFSLKLGGIGENEIRFNEFFTNSQNTPTLF